MSSTVRDVMTTHVAAVRKTASYKAMAAMLHEQRVSAFPVIDDDYRVIGIVSESDLLTKEALAGSNPHALSGMIRHREQAKANGLDAGDLMTSPAVTVGPDEPVSQAARLMYGNRVKRLPVVDADKKLIGIVTRTDVLTVYDRKDNEIRDEILLSVILQRHRGEPAAFQVSVTDGIVTIEGTPETAVVGNDIIADARHVEGVVAVRDRLSYPPTENQYGPGPLF
jgi:CBS-domain-containing membrane protein